MCKMIISIYRRILHYCDSEFKKEAKVTMIGTWSHGVSRNSVKRAERNTSFLDGEGRSVQIYLKKKEKFINTLKVSNCT